MKSSHQMEDDFCKQIRSMEYIVSLWNFQKEKEPELRLLNLNILRVGIGMSRTNSIAVNAVNIQEDLIYVKMDIRNWLDKGECSR